MSSGWSEQTLDPPQGCRMVGAMRAFHGIKDGFVVLHSPPGCHSGALLLNVLPDNTQARVALSGLHTRDLVEEEQKELKELLAKVQFYLRGFYGMNCAVIGDAGKAVALARFLANEAGLVVRVLAITSVNPWWEAEGNEDSLQELAEEVLIEPDRCSPYRRERSGRLAGGNG